ncbi:MAG: hypothetical protein M3Y65_24955 [Pseudomonadota bacterium]|nr:hypothetical protein [Pseudomonadota bacterium]
MKKYIEHGEQTPKGYGVSYVDYSRAVLVCLPLGLNFIVGWAMAAYFRLSSGPSGKFTAMLEQAQRSGFKAGLAAGEKRGYADGRDQAHSEGFRDGYNTALDGFLKLSGVAK